MVSVAIENGGLGLVEWQVPINHHQTGEEATLGDASPKALRGTSGEASLNAMREAEADQLCRGQRVARAPEGCRAVRPSGSGNKCDPFGAALASIRSSA